MKKKKIPCREYFPHANSLCVNVYPPIFATNYSTNNIWSIVTTNCWMAASGVLLMSNTEQRRTGQ